MMSNIHNWAKKIDWNKRVKAVCKPCWEIKYCPYGILVNQFPFKEEFDEKSCKIYGHDCPVYYVAEPLSETKQLRRITRKIPRITQFRVLKRDNQVCAICNKSVRYDEIEFDHIIPWAKGGSSNENNIRILCRKCNRNKSDKFENEFLISDLSERLNEGIKTINTEIISDLTFIASFFQEFYKNNLKYPNELEFANEFNEGEITEGEVAAKDIFCDLKEFFNNSKPFELSSEEFEALKYRWGFEDNIVYYLKEVVDEKKIKLADLLRAEFLLLEKLGFHINLNAQNKNKWIKM